MASLAAPDPAQLIEELERLLAEERELSAVRERLHARIDLGFQNEVTAARERQISDERLRLHQRIDALRAELGRVARGPGIALSERRRLTALGL
jgi:hypothetical protein